VPLPRDAAVDARGVGAACAARGAARRGASRAPAAGAGWALLGIGVFTISLKIY
jgi:hypothetical protein